MEQRAPRLASAGKILGTLIIIATAINLKLDLLEKPGLSLEEYITISVAFVLFLIAFFASKEREIVELTNNMSLEEQFAQLESTPTKSSGVIGSYQVQSSQTQGIIDSILGEKAEVNEQQVSQAIGTLSTGDFGQAAQSMAEQLPAPHKHAEGVVESPQLTTTEVEIPFRENVPLPTQIAPNNTPREDITELPNLEFAVKDGEVNAENRNLPDLSDLFNEEITEQESDKITQTSNSKHRNCPILMICFNHNLIWVQCFANPVWTQHYDLHSHSTNSDGEHSVDYVPI